MPRIPRVRGLPSLQAAIAPSSSTPAATLRSPFAVRTASAALSTSARLHGTNTDWLRKKLWKGEAPGPEDPYTQRPEPEDGTSNLPEEALQAAARRRDYTPKEVERSRLVLPPRQRVEAATEKELESLDPSYAPATSVEDLAEIQPVKTWWDQPGHWGAESEFRGFAAPRVEDRAVVEVALRRAVVEALALRDAGLLGQWSVRKWPAGARAELDETLAVEIRVQEDGEATLKGDVQALAGKLTSEAEEPETAEAVSAEEAHEIVKSWDASWKHVSIKDQHLKFAIRKRVYQLTGRLIPDSKLGAARTAQHLLTLTVRPDARGRKLAEVLETRGDLPSLPNVTVHSKKIGPVAKETAIGRWKVIEEELTKRGLPVLGTAGLGKNKERDWLTGKR